MTTRIAKQLAKIPLWRREIPRRPLYFKGDEKRQEFLPLFWMKMIPPEIEMPEYMVTFIVHPQMSKRDIKQYLEKIYKVPVLNVRTELRVKEITANTYAKGKLLDERQTLTTDEEKYAYVHLADDTFTYPDYFKDGAKGDMTDKILQKENLDIDEGKFLAKRGHELGLPVWFTGYQRFKAAGKKDKKEK